VDPGDPARGFYFDGRVTENFKLATGTWVSVGSLRLALIEALAPLVEDCVIAGENRDDIAVLAWVRRAETADFAGLPANSSLADLSHAPSVVDYLRERLRSHNLGAGGSSRKVARLIVLDAPPIGEEIAEKGYINQRATLARRAGEVARLYASNLDSDVIVA
jgi:feruloyl-CoA synthase